MLDKDEIDLRGVSVGFLKEFREKILSKREWIEKQSDAQGFGKNCSSAAVCANLCAKDTEELKVAYIDLFTRKREGQQSLSIHALSNHRDGSSLPRPPALLLPRVAPGGPDAPLCPGFSLEAEEHNANAMHPQIPTRPSECDDVIRRAHVSRSKGLPHREVTDGFRRPPF